MNEKKERKLKIAKQVKTDKELAKKQRLMSKNLTVTERDELKES